MMNRPCSHLPQVRRHGGFSLIEVLVAIVIAMVGVIIMTEVLIMSEERTRTTSGGNEALSSGAVMMHMMQRDLVQSGYGINSSKLLGCTLNITRPDGGVAAVPMAPVTINPPAALMLAGDANTDTLLVMYGNTNGQPEGNEVFMVDAAGYAPQSITSYAVGDHIVPLGDSCTTNLTLAKVTAVSAATNRVAADAQVAGSKLLFNMGQNPRVVGYAVRSGALSSCDFMVSDCTEAASWTAVAANIVSLQAQYGHDTTAPSMDGSVDTWVKTFPAASSPPSVAAACTWARTPAVRFALVARSAQYETRLDPTTQQRTCDTVTAAAPPWLAASSSIDVSGVGTDWQCYRYRTFETIAPSRNIVWMGAQTGC